MKAPALNAIKSAAHPSVRPLRFAHLQRYGLAALSVGSALAAGLLLEHFHFRVPSALLLLFAVALSSWYGGRGPAVLAAVLSIITFYWYFVQPVRTIYIDPSEIPYFITFVSFVALLSWFGTVRRRAEKALREQANLLNLTHDTVFVMDMEGAIQYWNRGAEGRYGWTAEEAVGKAVHDLLKTAYPVPQEQIKAELIRTGRWEGELVHARRDGTPVIVASRWALQRDPRGTPVAILETNNDITERKRGEEALRRLNRELRAISNCNQVLLRANDEQSLLERICRIVCEEAGYSLAWVGYAVDDEAKSVRPVAWTGAEEGYLASARITWADTDRGRGHTGTAIRCGESCCIQDFAADPRVAPWREDLLQRSFRSGIALPLRDEHNDAFGSLTIHSAQPNAFTPEEIRLLEELAADLAFGILTLRSRTARKHAEQEVALLSFALDNVREAALLIDDAARFHYVNNEGCRVLGYTRAELLGMSVPDIDPEFPGGHWSDHWRDLKAQRSLSFESRHRTRDGRTFPVEISANYFEYGGRAYNLGLVRDITERKRAEEALRRSEAYLSEAQRLTHTGAWATDAAPHPLYWSEELFRLYGLNPQDGLPTHDQAMQRVHPEDRDKYAQAFHRAIHQKVDSDVEFRTVLPDGAIRYLYGLGHPVLNARGEVVEVVGTTVDITERRRAEETLRRSEAYLAESQRLTHTGTFVGDNTTKPLYWSEELFRIYGFDPQQGLPTREQPLQRTHPEDRDKVLQAFDRAIREKLDADAEYRIVLPDGTIRHLYGQGHPVLNARGEVVEVVGTTVDITERKRAEEALRRSEAYLKEAQGLSHTGSWALDASTREYSYWSDEMFRIFGVDPHSGIPIRETMGRRIHPEDASRATAGFEKSLREKVDTSDEYRFVLPDGTIKHLQSIRHPVLNDAGDVVQLVGTFVDITERKRAEESLRESEMRFRTFVDHAADAFFLHDQDHKVLDVNRQACENLGYTREELIGMYPLDFDPDIDAARLQQICEQLAAGQVCTFETRHRRKNGTVFPVEISLRPFRRGDRQLHLALVRDITDRKAAAEALREGETRFRTFVDHAGDALFVQDLEQGTIVDVNRTACESLGYSRQELIGKTPLAFQLDSDRAEMESVAERATAGETVVDTHCHRRKDGTVFPVEANTSSFWYGGRRFLLHLSRDISDRLRAEEQRDRLRQLEADLAHIDRVSILGELTASIAHEVNQPLSGIVSSGSACLRWLARDVPDLEEAREAARRIVRDGKRAGEVIARIRALTKKAVASGEKLDLNETIREVLALVGDEAKRNTVVIRTRFGDDVFPVLGDQVQLQQVVLNLVMNAIEAMSSVGDRARELVITTRNIDPDQVLVAVEDSGTGIDPQMIDKIFGSFYTTKPGGMGMGLSISRSILEAHGGRLWATAKDGAGTIFHFTLPKYREEESNAGVTAV